MSISAVVSGARGRCVRYWATSATGVGSGISIMWVKFRSWILEQRTQCNVHHDSLFFLGVIRWR